MSLISKLMRIALSAVIVCAFASPASGQQSKERQKKSKGKTSTEIGIRKIPVQDVNAPPPLVTLTSKKPGRNKKLNKSYDDAPPMIPHTVIDYLPIGQRNQCLNCHTNPPRIYRNVVVVPASHYVDRKGRKVGQGPVTVKDIYQGFYNCTMCHAPQADAAPLKPNVFRRGKR